ncbi:stress transcription factor A [Seminavis robusta]|uniref:Stress transcription factor A n=1 Tax=Seminavis robusta TaxID=568900 RepID=A0A9N8DDD4_9STRA|nr:stress transcription factor A [Seminavis robusta]|eukprot:Sro95_g049370.1 stress transcription factor A (299) ;mRNA; r:97359-98365
MTPTAANNASFPVMVHKMLTDIDDLTKNDPNEKISHIISWQPHGRAFKIHDREKFATVAMPIWFMRLKYSSWVRQLNQYGFKKIQDGPDRGALYHDDFLRGDLELAQSIGKAKRKSKSDSSNSLTGLAATTSAAASKANPVSPTHVKPVSRTVSAPAIAPSSMMIPSLSRTQSYLEGRMAAGHAQPTMTCSMPSSVPDHAAMYPGMQQHPGRFHHSVPTMIPQQQMGAGEQSACTSSALVNMVMPAFKMDPTRFSQNLDVDFPAQVQEFSSMWDLEPLNFDSSTPLDEQANLFDNLFA